MCSSQSLRGALAAADDGPKLKWAEMYSDRWDITTSEIEKDPLPIKIRHEADIKILMRRCTCAKPSSRSEKQAKVNRCILNGVLRV